MQMKLVTVKYACLETGASMDVIRKAYRLGKIGHEKRGRDVWINLSDLQNYLVYQRCKKEGHMTVKPALIR